MKALPIREISRVKPDGLAYVSEAYHCIRTRPHRPSPIMRQDRTTQASLFDIFATHEIGRELKQISHWLDQHRPLLRLISNDLRRGGVRETGRRGLPAEAVLRCALLKQYRQLSCEELVFCLANIVV